MKNFVIYTASSIASTVAFVLILSLFGILGPVAFATSLTILKFVGLAALWFLMVRVPIAIIKSREVSAIKKIRDAHDSDAVTLLKAASEEANRDRISLKVPKVDHPITPMPLDPDEE